MPISPKTVRQLREKGYFVKRVDELMDPTSPDEVIFGYASKYDYVLVTMDLGFGKIISMVNNERPSTIIMRLTRPTPSNVAKKLIELIPEIEQKLREGYLIIIEDNRVRTKKIPY